MSLAADVSAEPGGAVVEATGIRKHFGATVALSDARLRVERGEVHALVGRNGAGKSTLVSILTGLQSPDAGEVQFGGQPAPAPANRAAWREIVACVYQKLTIVPTLTVAENVFLNRQATSSPVIGWSKLRRRAEELLAEWEMDVDVRAPAGSLTVEQRQLIEIARALSFGARFVILDEPTARLDGAGVQRLFSRIRQLRQQGVTFLYISHHLQEIFELCQTVTVFRDARHILTAPVNAVSRAELVDAMTGEHGAEAVDPRSPAPSSASDPLLAVAGVTVTGACTDISLQVASGEVVGLAGAGGSGKFAVAETVVGLRKPNAGSVRIAGKAMRLGRVPDALRAGVGFVPQDRHKDGLVVGLSIAENVTMAVPHRLGRYGFVNPRRREAITAGAIRELGIVAAGPSAPASSLSGGNQQKVVMARAIADDPRVLVLMSPTAGVDVKSKEALMERAVQAARGGSAVLVVGDDLDDLRYCHRVLVMFRGDVVAEFRDTWDDAAVVAAMEGVEFNRD
ncbi:MAG: simple sugar transport system ATP-binding protein [Actinomycetota bacterium]|nr:simple sugar transport system ATP-binding protein [Actinomycetota bacterium]